MATLPSIETREYRYRDIGTPSAEAINGFTVSLGRKERDQPNTGRITVKKGEDVLQILPSKGLSVGEFRVDGHPVFWDPPFERLLNPDLIDLHAPLLIDGRETYGFRWIENFVGGIEFLGLANWGLPYTDAHGVLHPLHGEVSNIPVATVACSISDSQFSASGTFPVHTALVGRSDTPWYARGTVRWDVTRTITWSTVAPQRLTVVDKITNRQERPASPDWGYHIQFFAEEDAVLRLPGASVHNRDQSPLPDDFSVWRMGPDPTVRRERGIVYRGHTPAEEEEKEHIRGSVSYRDGRRTIFTIPRAAYLQGWFSSGGAGSTEFVSPESPNEILMEKPWNGLGPEFGSSALDHDGDVDPTVAVPVLEPGRSMTLTIEIEPEFSPTSGKKPEDEAARSPDGEE